MASTHGDLKEIESLPNSGLEGGRMQDRAGSVPRSVALDEFLDQKPRQTRRVMPDDAVLLE